MKRRQPYQIAADRPALVSPQVRKLCHAALENCTYHLSLPILNWQRYHRVDHRSEDIAWLTSRVVRPFSFAWLCQALDLDEDATRRAMLANVPSKASLWLASARKAQDRSMGGGDA